MSANTLLTSVITGGTNNHTTTAEELNVISTDFVTQGVVGAITLNSGAGGTGSFCVNADASPDMGVTIKSGQAYITATPSSQNSQVLRVRASTDYTTYTINANTSGSTKYDWIYLSVSATNANNPSADGSNVTSFVTSRSSSNTTDNGTPPTYGLLLAIVTVANGASSITNSNITDKRFNTSIGAQNGSLIVTQNGTGTNAIVQAAGTDANINLNLSTKGTGIVEVNGTQVGQQAFKNLYKFGVYLANAQSVTNGTWGKISYDTKEFDTSTNIDVVTNKGRFTAPIAGFYQFNAAGFFGPANGNTACDIAIYKNGTEFKRGQAIEQGNNASSIGLNVSSLLQLAANDYVEIYWFNGDSLSRNLSAGANLTWFNGFLVSAV